MIQDAPVSKEGLSLLTGMLLSIHFADKEVSLDIRYYRKCSQLFYSSLQFLGHDEIAKLHDFIQSLWDVIFQQRLTDQNIDNP